MEREPDARALDTVEDQEREADDEDAEIVVVDRLEEIDREGAELDVREAGDALDALGPAEGIGEALPRSGG